MSDYQHLNELLKCLCSETGVTGDEVSAAGKVVSLLSGFMPCEVDKMGNVVGRMTGKGPHIILDAHLDRIGLIVTYVTEDGFIKVSKCGGVDARTLAAATVTIYGKKVIKGVITSVPPHLKGKDEGKKAASIDEILIDTGLTEKELCDIVSPGDRVVVDGKYSVLSGNRASSPCIDDRSGLVAILRCLEILKEQGINANITVLFSAQEETSSAGARTASFASCADEAICVDVSFASQPGAEKKKYPSLGSGTMIGIAPSIDREISDSLSSLAADEKINHTFEVMGGRTGTNLDDIQTSGKGIKSALLSIPLRNMHTSVEVVSLADIEATALLLAAYIRKESKSDD